MGNVKDVFADQTDTTDEAADEQSPNLESEVEAGLAKLRGEEPKEEETPTEEETPKETPKETPEEEKESEETPKEEESEEAPDEESDDTILPAGYRRAAVGSGWTEEEVDHFLKTQPDAARDEFGKIYDKWQEKSSVWSERGRVLKAAGKKPEEKPETAPKSDALSHFDAEVLKEANPESEGLIDALVAPLNATIDKVNAAVEKISHSEEFLQTTEQNALRDALDDFFGSEGMKSHLKTYGAKFEDLTDEQGTSRMELIEQADIISSGAADHGQDLSVHEAMARAFIQVSHKSRGEQIRAEVRESLKKRTKSMKGSHQKTTTPEGDDGGPITEKELERRTEARLAEQRNK